MGLFSHCESKVLPIQADLGADRARTNGMRMRACAIALVAASVAGGCGTTDFERTGRTTGNDRVRLATGDPLRRAPYMGVSCPAPNEFACDRVGLAVWLHRPALEVEAAIEGRQLDLDDRHWSGPLRGGEREMFAGFLQPAGLIDGPLKISADAGRDRWVGRAQVSGTVRLRIRRVDGSIETTVVEVPLSAGWG